MQIPFDQMPKNARLWIYQADRILSALEQEKINTLGNQFLANWAAHGSGLKSSMKLLHDRFLIIAVDEAVHAASGCSIDSCVNFVKTVGKNLNIDWFDRTKVAFIYEEEVFMESINNIKQTISEGKINQNTLTFNNLVQSVGEFDEKWLMPANETWLKRYF